MKVVGLDIGYSNCKVIAGDSVSGKPKLKLAMPAGAGPAHLMPQRVVDARDANQFSGVPVLVDGQDWVAGVEHGRLQGYERALDRSYTDSDQYRASFYAALSLVESPVIDHLVTGLPVSLYSEVDVRTKLARAMTGQHEIWHGKTVTVERVSVIQQPLGAYIDLVSEYEDVDLLDRGRILIIDPGFFSLDWVVIEGGELRTSVSNTSFNAVSRVLELVNDRIYKAHGARVGVSTLEQAFRCGHSTIYGGGEKIDVRPYVTAAAAEVISGALKTMQGSLRLEERDVDLIAVAGGGAQIVEPAVREVFSKSKITVSKDPVLANARGFWLYGT